MNFKALLRGGLLLGVLALTGVSAFAADAPGSTVRKTATAEGYAREWVIPPHGTPYCYQPNPDLPGDLAACPNVNWNGAVAPNPNIGPTAECPAGQVAVIAGGTVVCGKPIG